MADDNKKKRGDASPSVSKAAYGPVTGTALAALEAARRAGKSPDDIWKAAHVFPSHEGKPQFEFIGDQRPQVTLPEPGGQTTLGKLYNGTHDKLFTAGGLDPDLPVHYAPPPMPQYKGYGGFYQPSDLPQSRYMWINSDEPSSKAKDHPAFQNVRDIVGHEVRHFGQDTHGEAVGVPGATHEGNAPWLKDTSLYDWGQYQKAGARQGTGMGSREFSGALRTMPNYHEDAARWHASGPAPDAALWQAHVNNIDQYRAEYKIPASEPLNRHDIDWLKKKTEDEAYFKAGSEVDARTASYRERQYWDMREGLERTLTPTHGADVAKTAAKQYADKWLHDNPPWTTEFGYDEKTPIPRGEQLSSDGHGRVFPGVPAAARAPVPGSARDTGNYAEELKTLPGAKMLPNEYGADVAMGGMPIKDKAGKTVGSFPFEIHRDKVVPSYPEIKDETARGYNYGKEAYKVLTDWTHSTGRDLVADSSNSPSSQKVYPWLQDRGYPVEQNPLSTVSRGSGYMNAPEGYEGNFVIKAPGSTYDTVNWLDPDVVDAARAAGVGQRKPFTWPTSSNSIRPPSRQPAAAMVPGADPGDIPDFLRRTPDNKVPDVAPPKEPLLKPLEAPQAQEAPKAPPAPEATPEPAPAAQEAVAKEPLLKPLEGMAPEAPAARTWWDTAKSVDRAGGKLLMPLGVAASGYQAIGNDDPIGAAMPWIGAGVGGLMGGPGGAIVGMGIGSNIGKGEAAGDTTQKEAARRSSWEREKATEDAGKFLPTDDAAKAPYRSSWTPGAYDKQPTLAAVDKFSANAPDNNNVTTRPEMDPSNYNMDPWSKGAAFPSLGMTQPPSFSGLPVNSPAPQAPQAPVQQRVQPYAPQAPAAPQAPQAPGSFGQPFGGNGGGQSGGQQQPQGMPPGGPQRPQVNPITGMVSNIVQLPLNVVRGIQQGLNAYMAPGAFTNTPNQVNQMSSAVANGAPQFGGQGFSGNPDGSYGPVGQSSPFGGPGQGKGNPDDSNWLAGLFGGSGGTSQ